MLAALLLVSLLAGTDAPPLVQDRAQLVIGVYHSLPTAKEAGLLNKAKGYGTGNRTIETEAFPAAQRLLPSDLLEYMGAELTPEQRRRLLDAKRVVALTFSYPSADLAALRAANEVVHAFAAASNGIVFDVTASELLDAKGWKARRLDRWADGIPEAPYLFTVHTVAEDDGTVTLDSAGLERFGLARLELRGSHRSQTDALWSLVNVVVQSLVEGNRPDPKGRFVVELDRVRSGPLKKAWLGSSKANAKRRLTVWFHAARDSDGAPFFRVDFDPTWGAEPGARYDRGITELFGHDDSVTVVEHDDRVLAASQRARSDLVARHKPKLARPLPPGEILLVKAPFEYSEGQEWMWVEVTRWEGKRSPAGCRTSRSSPLTSARARR